MHQTSTRSNFPNSFGSIMEGRSYEGDTSLGYLYGFNGKERDDETYGDGNCLAFEARIYDSRLGRFFSTDPLEHEYPWHSTYCFASNNPIALIDYLGLGSDDPFKNTTKKGQTLWGVSKEYYKNNKDRIGTTWGEYWANVQIWNKGGDYGKIGGTMKLSSPEFGKGDKINAGFGDKNTGTIKIDSYNPSRLDVVGNVQDNFIGLKIEIGYKDNKSGFSNFNWIQNITREGWYNPDQPKQFVDPYPIGSHNNYPFYYDTREQYINTGQSSYNAYFYDEPVKAPKSLGNPRNISSYQKFYAELTLVGKNRNGIYVPLITITYGFETYKINGKGQYNKFPIKIQQPSDFQKNVIQNLNKPK